MPKHPVSLWLIAERKRRRWKAEEVARRLRDAGVEAADGTYRVWEAGRKPSDAAIRAMETLFDSIAPKDTPPAADVATLLAAIDAQRKDIADLQGMVTSLVGLIHQERVDPPWWVSTIVAQGKAITIALGLDVEDAKK